MSIIRNILEIISNLSDLGYIGESELWFDSVWKKVRNPYCGDGTLVEKNGRLYRRFKVIFDDETIGIFVDCKDKGTYVEDAFLSSSQKHDLKKEGMVVIKHYNG